MRQALGPGALGRPRGIGWRGRWEGGSGWGTHVNPWLFISMYDKIHYNKKKKKEKKNENPAATYIIGCLYNYIFWSVFKTLSN